LKPDISVQAKAFIELDSRKVLYIDFGFRIAQQADRSFDLVVHTSMPDYAKTFFVTLKEQQARHWQALCRPDTAGVEFAIGLETTILRTLRGLIRKPREPLFTTIKYEAGAYKADSAVLLLLNHLIETKARVKKMNGRTFVNLKTLTEGEIILHSLFVLLKEQYRDVKDIVCKLVVTGNNFSDEGSIQAGFRGRRARNQKAARITEKPVAYDIINLPMSSKNNATLTSFNTLGQAWTVFERSMNSIYLSETNLNPSSILRSYLYRLDQNKLEEMVQLLLSTVSMIDQNFIFFSKICRVFSTYFLFSMKIKPPESFECLREKNKLTKDLSLPGFWADKLRISVSIYNFDLHQMEFEDQTFLLKDLLTDFEVGSLEGLYRSIVCGGIPLYLYLHIQDLINRIIYVEQNSLKFNGFFPDKTIEKNLDSQRFAHTGTENNLFSGFYHLIDPYRVSSSKVFHKSKQVTSEGIIFSGNSKQDGDVQKNPDETNMPWGTRYKRLQIMDANNKIFYCILRLQGCLMRLRLVYHGESNHEEIHLSTCNLETNEVYKIVIYDKVTVERLINLIMLQKEVLDFCPQYLKVSTNLFMDISKGLSGRNLMINNVYKDRVSVVRQETIEQTKWNVFCQLETVYLKNFFKKKVLYFATTHKVLGKVYVTGNIYYSFKLNKNQLIVLLTISPVRKRFTCHQIVLNALDLSTFFDTNIFEIVHNDQGLVKLFCSVIAKLVLVKSRVFSKLAIPVQWIRRLTNPKYTELLENEFDQRNLFSKKESDPIEPYLKPKIYSKEVVIKMAHRFNNQYWILTVTRHLLLDRVDIEGYVPATRRRFQCRMSAYDIDVLSMKTQSDLLKMSQTEINVVVDYCLTFQQFEDTIKEPEKCQKIFDSRACQFVPKKKVQGQKQIGGKGPTMQGFTNRSTTDIIDQISGKNFSSIKFWFELLCKSKLLLKHNDLLIEIHSFKGVLQEHLWDNVCIIDNLKFEIGVDLDSTSSSTVASKNVKVFTPINMDSLSSYSFLLKVIFIEQDQQIHVDKVILEGLIKIYGLLLQEKLVKMSKLINFEDEESHKVQENEGAVANLVKSSLRKSSRVLTELTQSGFAFKLRHLRLADLIELCRILEVNMMDNILGNYMGVIDSQLTYFNNEKILSREVIYKENFERRMKLNSRLCLGIMSDPHYKDYNDILLCRTVFTVRPLQTLAVLVNKKRKLVINLDEEFTFHIYDNKSCKVKTCVKTFAEICENMPHALTLIDNMKFAEVSKRLVALYKNSLLVDDYFGRR
jgi:hypothetical protein